MTQLNFNSNNACELLLLKRLQDVMYQFQILFNFDVDNISAALKHFQNLGISQGTNKFQTHRIIVTCLCLLLICFSR